MKRFSLCGALIACVPTFEDTPWRIDTVRVLAIASTPAEARPAEVIDLTALSVGPEGPIDARPRWSACTVPRRAQTRTQVSSACLRGEGLHARNASGPLLRDACARFGPNVPPATENLPPQRPADPDPSGGYFVPIRAEVDNDVDAWGSVRVRCDLAGATRMLFEAFETGYRPNVAPSVQRVVQLPDTVAEPTVDPGSIPVVLPPDTQVRWRVEVGAAESYVRYDAPRTQIVSAREWLRVDWYATDGSMLEPASARRAPTGDDDGQPLVFDTSWRTPRRAGPAWLWVVVTDARGGVGWQALSVVVDDAAPMPR